MIGGIVSLGLLLQAAPAAGAAAQTPQQRFDTASDAAGQGECAKAVELFTTLEQDPAIARNAFARATIDVRKGICQIRIGQIETGEAAIRRGLPALEAKGASFDADVRDAHLALGDAAGNRLDYDVAATEYRRTLARSAGTLRVQPLIALSRVLTFDHDGEALKAATEAREIVLADPKITPKEVAVVQTQYARVLLNDGKLKEAYAELRDSLRKQGGLGIRVSLSDIITRSDLAIAALLNKDQEQARLYLAYTGAGRVKDTPFGRAVDMEPPFCGDLTGLKPDDYAIVEFSLGEDGQVLGVSPVYATGGREVALAFARAVRGWSWRAEDAKGIPPVFRYSTRVELRCTRSGERPSPTGAARAVLNQWLDGQSLPAPAWTDRSDAAALPLIRAAMTQARAGGERIALLRALVALSDDQAADWLERRKGLDEAVAIAEAANAPAAARTYLTITAIMADNHWLTRADQAHMRAMLARPDMAADPISRATTRLVLATPSFRMKPPSDSAALLQAVIDEPDLPSTHPLRIAALLQSANALAAHGDIDAARATFDKTGLSERQCAIVAPTPMLRSTGASSNDFPMEAARFGFEGWARTEFDIAPNGTTATQRVLVSYPPFIFDEAARGIARQARYSSSYRPNGSMACTANRQSIIFNMP